MRRWFAVLLAMVVPSYAVAEPLTLVNDGKPAATIVVSSRPNPSAWFAAGELQYHARLMTGAELPIVNDREAAKVAGTKILVGESDATRRLGLKNEDFAPQEYLIRFAPGGLVLMGRDELGGTFPMKQWGAPRRVEGRFGKAMAFDGSAALAVMDHGFSDEAGTFEAWVHVPEDGQGGGNFIRIEGRPWGYHLFARDGRKVRYVTFQNDAGSGIDSRELAAGWHHVMGTFDAAANKKELFIDGESHGTANYAKTSCHAAELFGLGSGDSVRGMATKISSYRCGPWKSTLDYGRICAPVHLLFGSRRI